MGLPKVVVVVTGTATGRFNSGRLVGFPCGPRISGGGVALFAPMAAAAEVAVVETRAAEGRMVSNGVSRGCGEQRRP